MTEFSRRAFLAGSAGVLAGSALLADTLTAHAAWSAATLPTPGKKKGPTPWGPLAPVADQNGVYHLALPPGFTYRSFSATGAPMSDGALTPQHHDGMAAFKGPKGTIRLIRNHEITASRSITGVAFPVAATGFPGYDGTAKGGTVTIDFDPKTGSVRDFVSLTGTIYNCSGGISLDGKHWISCEETTHGTAGGRFGQDHGFCFQVPVGAEGPVAAQPLKAMGRFNHEAAVTDPKTGIVYLTEDRYGSACGFYRFVPNDKKNLALGGTLQMLAIHKKPGYDTRAGQKVNKGLDVAWVTIAQPDNGIDHGGSFGTPNTIALGAVAGQGFAQGAAAFDRLEGAFATHDGSIFFVSTSGGSVKQPDPNAFLDAFTGQTYYPGYGQIWELQARARGGDGRLRLVYESPGKDVLDSPDNLTITPHGGLLLCEDDTAWTDLDSHPLAPGITNPNRLVAVADKGQAFDFAVQLIAQAPDASKGGTTSKEFAGACFSPDGRILFVNLYGNNTAASGNTFAISGPWKKGGL